MVINKISKQEIDRLAYKSYIAHGIELGHLCGGLNIYMNFRSTSEKDKITGEFKDKLEFIIWFYEYPDRPPYFLQHEFKPDYNIQYWDDDLNHGSSSFSEYCTVKKIKNNRIIYFESYDYPYVKTVHPEKYVASSWNLFTVFEYTKRNKYTSKVPDYDEISNLIVKGVNALVNKYNDYNKKG